MDLNLIRTDFTNKSTIGQLSINGEFFCFVLEDQERELSSSMTRSELLARKVFGKTAIPTGRYEIILSFSERFQKQLPLLLNVPAFEGIRIHNGNGPNHTEGCLLVGSTKQVNLIGNSKVTLSKLIPILSKAAKTDKIFIEVNSHQPIVA